MVYLPDVTVKKPTKQAQKQLLIKPFATIATMYCYMMAFYSNKL